MLGKVLVCILVIFAVCSVEGHRSCNKKSDCRRKECCLNVGHENHCVHWSEQNAKCRVSQQPFRRDRDKVLEDFCPCGKDLSCNEHPNDANAAADIGKCEPKRCVVNRDCAWRHCCVDGFCRRRGVLGDTCVPGSKRRKNEMMHDMCDCLSSKYYCRDDGLCERKP